MRRSPPLTCGIWPNRAGMIAVVLPERGAAVGPLRIARTDDALAGFLAYLETLRVTTVVVPETLARDGPLAARATGEGLSVWIAPASLIEPIRRVAGPGGATPRASAAMLARLPNIAPLRGSLRRVATADPRQLPLL